MQIANEQPKLSTGTYPSSQELLALIESNVSGNKIEMSEANFKYLEDNGKMPEGVYLKCIDGRADKNILARERSLRKEYHIGIPGAGMGILVDAHAALHNSGVDMNGENNKKLVNLVKDVLGTGKISAHTDDHSPNEPFYAGCGHCLGIKNNMSEHDYNSSQETIGFIDSLSDQDFHYEGDNKYEGGHQEQGVVIIQNPTTIMPSYILDENKNPSQVFVYHRKWHEMIIKKLSEKLVKEFEVDLETLNSNFTQLIDLSRSQVGNKSPIMATTTRLALDKKMNIVEIN